MESDKFIPLLQFFDPKKYDHIELLKIINKIISTVKEKGGDHQLGSAWVILMLYKKGFCTILQIEDTLDEFNTYLKGFDDYKDSIVMGDADEAPLNYYNHFVHKKTKESYE